MRDLQTKDLFHFSRIMKKMNLKGELKGLFTDITGKPEKEKEKVKKDVAMQLAFTVMENISLAEREVYALLADLTGKKPEDIETLPLMETISILQELFEKKEFGFFFNSAMQ